MKIEKMNDHQIRCTLTHEDLDSRQIKLSELAYGSEKANQLFHDMMQQANEDFGFEVDNIPIMVEAVPLPDDQIMLLITKVDAPEELDTRFSNFTSFEGEGDDAYAPEDEMGMPPIEDTTAELMEMFDRINKAMLGEEKKQEPSEAKEQEAPKAKTRPVRIYTSDDMDVLITASKAVTWATGCKATLYKAAAEGLYYLVTYQNEMTDADYKRLNHGLSGYLTTRKYSPAILANICEHYKVIIPDAALEMLGQLD